MQKKITLIGSTGSIGRQVLQVVERYSDQFQIVAMAANSNVNLFLEQIQKVKPEFAVLRSALSNVGAGSAVNDIGANSTLKLDTMDKNSYKVDKNLGKQCKIASGESAFEDVCKYASDIVIVAASGFAGLKATLLALEAGRTVALANKESLVVAGDYVLQKAREKGVQILPLDSEHSAIWQALHFQTALTGQKEFSKLLLTASGGALRDIPIEELRYVTAREALRHPNWSMGSKITIDCATMLNKGYEVIEAMHLFGASLQDIEVVLHRESVVHSMVEWADGGILAQMGMPTMELPIQLALTYPKRQKIECNRIDWRKMTSLHFESMQERTSKKRYPSFYLAMEAAKKGGVYPLILNAWAEIAVQAFLNDKIAYTTIAPMIEQGLASYNGENIEQNYNAFAALDKREREKALHAIQFFK